MNRVAALPRVTSQPKPDYDVPYKDIDLVRPVAIHCFYFSSKIYSQNMFF